MPQLTAARDHGKYAPVFLTTSPSSALSVLICDLYPYCHFIHCSPWLCETSKDVMSLFSALINETVALWWVQDHLSLEILSVYKLLRITRIVPGSYQCNIVNSRSSWNILPAFHSTSVNLQWIIGGFVACLSQYSIVYLLWCKITINYCGEMTMLRCITTIVTTVYCNFTTKHCHFATVIYCNFTSQ